MTTFAHGPGSRGPRQRTSRLLLLTVLTALVAGTCASPAASPSPSSGTTAQGSTTPTTSTSPTTPTGGTGGTAPTPTERPTGDWAKVDLPTLKPVASLAPTRIGKAGAALDTAFRLTSLDGTPAAALVPRLEVQPKIKLTSKVVEDDTVLVTPASPLLAGQTYRFALRREDGTLAASWVTTTAKTLRVVGTLPEDEATNVPRNTGIELTFDQRGVSTASVSDRFSISPAAKGRFEVHGKAIAFVPDKPLKALTVYTVTLRKGVPLQGTGQILERDVTFRFETRSNQPPAMTMYLEDDLVDTATADRPTIRVWFHSTDEEESSKLPASVPLTVHRFGGVAAAIAAYKKLETAPEWAHSGQAPVATRGLTLVLKGTVPVRRFEAEDEESLTWVQLPQRLPAGWYVVTFTTAGLRQQAIIQVSDLVAYSFVSETRSAIWVNSLRGGNPVKGAAARLGGVALGATDADGLRVATTPASVQRSISRGDPVFLTVRDGKGRSVFVPVTHQQECGKCWDTGSEASDEADAWWHVVATDRTLLRPTDAVKVWGVIRPRDGGAAPSTVGLRLTAYDESSDVSMPVVQRSVRPDANGMFTGELAFSDLPPGELTVSLVVDGDVVGTTWAYVGTLVKPAWQLALTTDRRAVLAGSPVVVSTTATFFDGTPVAGVGLKVGIGLDEEEDGEEAAAATTVGTDGDGKAQATVRPAVCCDEDRGQWDWQAVGVRPELPEEADLGADVEVVAFASTALLSVDGSIAGRRLTVSGKVDDVDFDAINANPTVDIEEVMVGGPRANAPVAVTVTEIIPTRKQIGTAYDFINKRTTPVYQYDSRQQALETRTVRTAANGTFTYALDVAGGDHDYRIDASYTDEGGRTIRAEEYGVVDRSQDELDYAARPWLEAVGTGGEDGYSLGEPVSVTVTQGHPDPANDRYLFLVSHQGLRVATVQDGPAYATAFRPAWVPNAQIDAVRFTGAMYEPVLEPQQASFSADDVALKVQVTPDAARYEPGGTVRLSIRTLGPDGRPTAASVVLRAIDEKLYAMDAAAAADILAELYASVGSGVLAQAWSHRTPSRGGEGGDTGGGGGDVTPRKDFQDQILFQRVTTGADGQATVSFKLSDDLTSWRVSADAVDRALEAGNASLLVPVGLPFFVETALAPEYLVGDQPILRVRGYGSALRAGETVTFRVSAPSIGLAPTTVTAPAFKAASVTLPKLTSVGEVAVRIDGTAGSGTAQHRDALLRTVHVTDSRAIQGRMASATLTDGFRLSGGTSGATTVVLTDGGRGQSLPLLLGFTDTDTGRADEAIAASVAQSTLVDVFGMPADEVGPDIDLSPFQQDQGNGIHLLPYGSSDLEVSALAAFARTPEIDEGDLGDYLDGVWTNEDEGQTAERRMVALAGLAGLGRSVLADVRDVAASASKLPVDQQTWVALAALGAGDLSLATKLERAILADAGERLGPWVRVWTGDAETSATATARLAIVATGIGDPLAADLDAYLAGNPPEDTLVDLERSIAARSWAERMPGTPAVASVTIDGTTRRLAIDPMEPTWLRLTPSQVVGAKFAPVSGTVVVASTWEGPLDASTLHDDGVASFRRTVTPAGTVGLADVVIVEYQVDLSSDADHGCWGVTDLVPSGLAPIAGNRGWYDDDGEDGAQGHAVGPWRIEGQRVDFCVSRDPQQATSNLRYVARVVTPGTYRWESPLLQSSVVRDHGMVLPATTLTIAAGGR